jgi:hypothetical protein
VQLDRLWSLRSRLSDEALRRYLVVNLGWVEVTSSRGVVRITMRPSAVSAKTLSGLFYYVWDQFRGSIEVSYFTDQWTTRHCSSVQAFVDFASSNCPAAVTPTANGARRFVRHRIGSIDSVFGPLQQPARLVAANVADPASIVRLLEAARKARWSVCEIDRETQSSRVIALSAAFGDLNPSWQSQGPGVRITDFANREYGDWVAIHHRETIERMTTAFDLVDARVHIPGTGEVRLRYECMTLPLVLSNGSHCVVCAALDVPFIDLRKTG